MDARCLGSVLFMLVYPGLPIALILAPPVRKLWAMDTGRGRAWEELLLALGVLIAPWLVLMGMQATGLAPRRDEGWFVTGLFVAVPLWSIGRLMLRLAPEMIRWVRRITRRPSPDDAWSSPAEGISSALLPLLTVVLALMLTLCALEISLDPNLR
jgi:hypothetical protein